MIALLSPAKNLNYTTPATTDIYTQPRFEKESQQLIDKLKKLSKKKVGELMHLSDNLAALNHERYQTWSLPFDAQNAKQAALAFNGEVYTGLNAKEWSEEDYNFAQTHLRILSGLHGLLRPLDLLQPYRLEMGTKFSAKPSQKNLYEFWGKKIAQELNADLAQQGDDIIVNLASNEYFKSVDKKTVKASVIDFQFKENKGGEYKMLMVYAKKARGLMAAYMIQNQISDPEQLKQFDSEGYCFNPNLSTDTNWAFTRG